MLWEQFLERKTEKFRKRIRLLGTLMVVTLGLLLARLAYLQLLEGTRYRELSTRNRVRLVPIKSQRGLIYDRNGALLASNVPTFTVALIPASFPPEGESRLQALALLETLLGVSAEEVETKLKNRGLRYYEPLRIKTNIDRFAAARIEEHRPELPVWWCSPNPGGITPWARWDSTCWATWAKFPSTSWRCAKGTKPRHYRSVGRGEGLRPLPERTQRLAAYRGGRPGRQKGVLGRKIPARTQSGADPGRPSASQGQELLGQQKGVLILERSKPARFWPWPRRRPSTPTGSPGLSRPNGKNSGRTATTR
jgi:hypothetical protein